VVPKQIKVSGCLIFIKNDKIIRDFTLKTWKNKAKGSEEVRILKDFILWKTYLIGAFIKWIPEFDIFSCFNRSSDEFIIDFFMNKQS